MHEQHDHNNSPKNVKLLADDVKYIRTLLMSLEDDLAYVVRMIRSLEREISYIESEDVCQK